MMMIVLLISCQHQENFKTGIQAIDENYEFTGKEVISLDERSIYTTGDCFYNSSLGDSVYMIGKKYEDGYEVRAHGWSDTGNKVGDWFYEKYYNDGRVEVDSILNYVVSCDKNTINTIKKYKNNQLDKNQGYFYELDINKKLHEGDTLEIDLRFWHDTIRFQKRAGNTFFFFLPQDKTNYCDTNTLIDSFPVRENTVSIRTITPEKGEYKVLGYYILFDKEPPPPTNDSLIKVTQVIVEMDFEVKK